MKIKQLKQNGQTFVPQTVSEAVLVKVGDEVLTLKHLLNFGNPEQVLVSTGGIPKWENQSSINAGKLGGLSVDELQLPAFAKFNIEDETITADTLQDSIKFTGTNIQISAQDKTINFAIPEMKDGVLGLVKGTNNTDLFLKGDGSWATPTNTWRSIIVGNNQLRGDINTGSLSIEAGKNTQIDLSDNILTISSTDTNTEYQSGEGLTLGDDNTFILNTADANNIGGIQLGYQSSKKNYAVQVDNRKAFVNVPWDVNLHVGSVDFKRKTTENGETYISVSEDGQFKNKYLIKGDGGTTVSSDSNGNITINSLPLHWTNLDGVPEDFIPSEHSHYTDQITRLEGYKKAETDSDLLVYDTLNQALGKLEYKAHLGYEAYNWYKAVTKDDIDESVNKWGEIVEFLNSMEEGSDILDMFVTRQTNQNVTGSKIFTEPQSFKKGFTVGTSDLVENLNSELLGGYSASTLFSKLESTDTGYLSLSIGNTEKSVQLKKAIASNTLAGGNAGNIVYQSATGKTAFLENPSSGSVLKFNGGVPEWGLDYYRPIAVDDSIILGNNNNIFNLKQGSNITLDVKETDSKDYNVTINSYYHDTLYNISGGISEGGYQLTLTSSENVITDLVIPIMKGWDDPMAGLVPTPTSENTFLKSDGTWDIPINTWRKIIVGDKYLDNSISSGDLTIQAGANTQINLNSNILTISSSYVDTLYNAGIGLSLDGNNTFNLQVAKSDSLGGIKIGYTSTDTTYAVNLDNDNNAYVEVPVRTSLSIAKNATNPLIGLIEAGSTINQYNITGEGNTTVSTDKDGNISIYSPTTLDWKYVVNSPEFAPAIHPHTTDVITVLNYSNTEDVSSIENNNTLNTALGKLDHKSNLGVLAYNWYKSVTGEDTDELINKWEEIVSFLNGVKEENNILNLFVTTKTAQTISGEKTFSVAPQFNKGFTTSSKDIITNLNAEYFGGFTTQSLFSSLTNDNYSLSITIGNKTETIDALQAYSANTIDGYHISVGKSAGTDPNTIYFVI